MVDNGVDETIDWAAVLFVLENESNGPSLDFLDQLASGGSPVLPESDGSLSIGAVEQYLLDDDSSHQWHWNVLADGFSPDVVLDSHPESGTDHAWDQSTSPELVEVVTDEEGKDEESPIQIEESDPMMEKKDDSSDDVDEKDPVAKKRKRQMRNRDAAVRSRERKKQYVNELEMKSKYYEAECKRLGTLLQYYAAENQALRLSLNNRKAFDASMTKQESAVLLLESLLLGSLLGFLGIIWLLILPSQVLRALKMCLTKKVLADSADQADAAPRRAVSNVLTVPFPSFMLTKRCRGTRTRMKPSLTSCVGWLIRNYGCLSLSFLFPLFWLKVLFAGVMETLER